MLLPGPEVTATWPAPNYDNPESRGPALIIVEAISMSLVLICISLRVYVKKAILRRRPEWDDWLMVLSVVRLSKSPSFLTKHRFNRMANLQTSRSLP